MNIPEASKVLAQIDSMAYEISHLRNRIDILQLKLKQVEATCTVQQNETKQEQEENQKIEAAAKAVYGHYSRAPLTAPDCVRNLVWLLIGRVL